MPNVPIPGEDFDLEKYGDLNPIEMMLAIRRDLEFKMPPRGLTTHRMLLAGVEYVRYTWRCEVPNCWYVCTPRTSDLAHVEQMKRDHQKELGIGIQCPTPPRRESLPSGYPEIQKLWREIDDIMDAMKADEAYRKMTGAELVAYAKGISFSIVMKDPELWPDIKSVAAEGVQRWKMRRQQIPWRATPTRHANDATVIGQSGGWAPKGPATDADRAKVGLRPSKSTRAPLRKPALPPSKVKEIQAALSSGMFSTDDIATMYGVTKAQVDIIKTAG